jgi:hypothetical protein
MFKLENLKKILSFVTVFFLVFGTGPYQVFGQNNGQGGGNGNTGSVNEQVCHSEDGITWTVDGGGLGHDNHKHDLQIPSEISSEDCEALNNPTPTTGSIIVIKNVVDSDGSTDISDDTLFTVNVGDDSAEFGEGQDAVFTDLVAGDYSISEDILEGYELVSIDIDDESDDELATVVAGATTTITIVNKVAPTTECNDGIDNDDNGQIDYPADSGCDNPNDDDEFTPLPGTATLTIKKIVVNDNNRTATSSDFTINVTGATSTSVMGSEAGVDLVLTTFGAFEVTEGAHPDYTVAYSEECSGTIEEGDHITCTVTNDDLPGVPPTCDEGFHLEGDSCVPDSVIVDMCSNIEGNQETLAGYERVGESECVAIDDEDTGGSSSGGSSSGGGHGRSSSRNSSSVGEVLGAFTGNCVAFINSYLKMGLANDPEQVKNLQSFLNEQGISVPITGFFGIITDNAVKTFQKNHKAETLAPWKTVGLSDGETPTGYVFKTTKYTINNMVCPGVETMPILP